VTGGGAVVLAALGGGYAVVCRFWPLAKCGKCTGSGKLPSPSGKAHRRCPRCEGRGDRLRWGARLFGGKR
jgi:hypothetical protein